MRYYPAIVRKEKNTAFGIDFPDFPGCVTAAADLATALAQAEEVLRFHADGMVEDGLDLPEPTPLEAVLESADARGGAVYMVHLVPPKGRAVRVNVTIDESLLAAIDRAATQSRMTRSGFLAQAVRETLKHGRHRSTEEMEAGPGRTTDRDGRSVEKGKRRMGHKALLNRD
jgi:predicted RNase H-like HicB family nuclease